jgi:hypothetical protein
MVMAHMTADTEGRQPVRTTGGGMFGNVQYFLRGSACRSVGSEGEDPA